MSQELSYFRLSLLSYLRDSHPHLANNNAFIAARGDAAALKKSNELKKLMTELKAKVDSYKVTDNTFLEKYLNNIAFLFKSDAYKNENEVRLVVKGIEFEKKYKLDVTPPLVYIELVSIKARVKQITLGPKVDDVNEWASVFHYRYEEDAPTIMISHLPYK